MRSVPGVSASSYAQALQEFDNAIGKPNVYVSDEDLDLYRDAYSILWNEPDERIASGALAPANVEQVQAIVRIANKYKIPLYPFSTGRNLGYGGSAPNYSGSVILDLKRMNRVLEINEEMHYCIVEPGVSFFDLYAEFRRRNVKLRASMPAPGWGSPIGNALDYGRGGPAGNNFRNGCGMEVVLPNGGLMRTGMGALPNANTWATYHNGVGPDVTGLFAQSNFGIVTKMGFNLFPWPETERRLQIRSRNYDDLEPLITIVNHLDAAGIAPGGSGIFSPLAWSQTPDVVELLSKPGGGSASQFNQLARDKNLDLYLMMLNFTGPDKITKAQIEVAQEKLSAIPGINLIAGDPVFAPQDIDTLPDGVALGWGKPGLQRFWDDTAQFGWDGHLWFSPLLPRTGAEVRRAQEVLGKACRDMNFYWGWPDTLWYDGGYCIVRNFSVSRTDKAMNQKTRDVVMHLIRVAADNGWSEYRTAPALQQAVVDTFSFNDHALMRFTESLKDAVDPNGIISPGRYGIWPKHLRKARG